VPALRFRVWANFALANCFASRSFGNISVALANDRFRRRGSSNETYHMPCDLLAIKPFARAMPAARGLGAVHRRNRSAPPARNFAGDLENHALGRRAVDMKNIRRPNIFPEIPKQLGYLAATEQAVRYKDEPGSGGSGNSGGLAACGIAFDGNVPVQLRDGTIKSGSCPQQQRCGGRRRARHNKASSPGRDEQRNFGRDLSQLTKSCNSRRGDPS
jgi:hypothetical protein